MQLKTKQGKTTSILGLAANDEMDIDCLQIALEAGINYFFFYNSQYSNFLNGLKTISLTNREQIIIATGSETRNIGILRSYIEEVLRKLNTDYIDIFYLEYISPSYDGAEVEAALDELYSLKEKGILRYVGVTTHNRPVALKFIDSDRSQGVFLRCDVLMHRYNIAHRKAEEDILPRAKKANIPVIAFTSTRWGSLLNGHPDWKYPPAKATDCYRYVLQNPAIHLTLTSPNNSKQLQENLAALNNSQLTPQEINHWRSYGDLIYGNGQDAFETQWS